MPYTLGEAAKASGKSKTSIRRALDSGRISGAKNDLGEWQIDPAELHRVFELVEHRNGDGTGDVARSVTPDEPPVTPPTEIELASVRARLETLEAERGREREQLMAQIADLREDRDQWRRQATGLLTDQRRKEEQTRHASQDADEGASWFSRLFRASRG